MLNKYKNGLLTNEEKQRLHSYYREELFISEQIQPDEKEILKYVTLGWYIYNHMEK
jgi:hypothetical protein